MAIARTTLSSKILTHDKDYFAKIAVDAVMCLKGRTNLEPIHIIKKSGGTLRDSFLADVRPHLPPSLSRARAFRSPGRGTSLCACGGIGDCLGDLFTEHASLEHVFETPRYG